MGALLLTVVNAAVLAALIALAGTFFKSWSERESGRTANRFCQNSSNSVLRPPTLPAGWRRNPIRSNGRRRVESFGDSIGVLFLRLYWGTFSIVEDPDVETAMVTLGKPVSRRSPSTTQNRRQRDSSKSHLINSPARFGTYSSRVGTSISLRSRTKEPSDMNQVLSQPPSLWLPALRRAGGADIATKIGNHTFRATGITAYLKNGGTLERAAIMANHASTRTTQLYDRRRDDVSLDEVERILI